MDVNSTGMLNGFRPLQKKLKINKKIHQLKEVYNIKKSWGITIKLFYDQ
jgi:hypothetical protein